MAKGWGGEYTHLSDSDAKPIALYAIDASIRVRRIGVGEATSWEEAICVAAVPRDSSAFKGIRELSLWMFKQNAGSAGGFALDLG